MLTRSRGPSPMLSAAGWFSAFSYPPQALGYGTAQKQRGTVTAVSATSISVKSADGFTATYVIDAETKINRDGAIASIKADADVLVQSLVEGGTVTAKCVVDTAAFGRGRGLRPGDADGDGDGSKDSPTPVPSASA